MTKKEIQCSVSNCEHPAHHRWKFVLTADGLTQFTTWCDYHSQQRGETSPNGEYMGTIDRDDIHESEIPMEVCEDIGDTISKCLASQIGEDAENIHVQSLEAPNIVTYEIQSTDDYPNNE